MDWICEGDFMKRMTFAWTTEKMGPCGHGAHGDVSATDGHNLQQWAIR